MAEFSKEYFESQKLSFKGDFSYLDEFKQLKEGESFIEICEGLGLYGIINDNGQPQLIVDSNNTTVEYFSYLGLLIL
jgi:hypothetical protein